MHHVQSLAGLQVLVLSFLSAMTKRLLPRGSPLTMETTRPVMRMADWENLHVRLTEVTERQQRHRHAMPALNPLASVDEAHVLEKQVRVQLAADVELAGVEMRRTRSEWCGDGEDAVRDMHRASR